MRTSFCWLALVLVSSACERGPAGVNPSPVDGGPRTAVALSLDQGSVSLGRGASAQIKAALSWSDGSTTDVTADAEWMSTDPAIASVQRGTVTVAASGRTTVRARYAGFTTSVDVDAYRNLMLRGRLAVSEVEGRRRVGGVWVSLDGRAIGGHGPSSYCGASTTAELGNSERTQVDVDAGVHTLAMTFTPGDFLPMPCPGPGTLLVSAASSFFEVVDRDTREVLSVVPLDRRELAGTSPQTSEAMRWTITIAR